MQKFWSIVFGAVMLGALLLFVVSPFVGWWLPKNVATFGGGIDDLFYLILIITGFFFVLTEAILVYNLFKFHYRPGQKAAYIHGNHNISAEFARVGPGQECRISSPNQKEKNRLPARVRPSIGAWKAPSWNSAPCGKLAFLPGTARAFPNGGNGARVWPRWLCFGPSHISRAVRLPRGCFMRCYAA